MKIALAQINPTVGDFAANRAKIARLAREAQAAGAALVVFPELSLCGYPPRDLVEKPPREEAPSDLAIIGRYILTPDIFDIIENIEPGKGGEIQITDALMKQAQSGCVIAYKFKGKRFDCGGAEGYIDATNFCFENYYKAGKAY